MAAAGVDTPCVSVVVPTRGRPQLLQRCLRALMAQTVAAEHFEIIVVDDGRDAATRALVATLARKQPAPSLRYRQPPPGARGPAAARNAGWRAAQGRVIAFTDDDTIASPHWLAEGLKAMAEGHCAVTGRVEVPIGADPTDYERNVKHLETAEFVTANCFVRRDTLAHLGGFDERFTRAWREDSDLHFALLERHGRIGHAPGARVLHPVRKAPWGVSLREQRNVFFDALLFKKHPRLYRQRIRANPPWSYYAIVLALLACAALSIAGAPRAALLALVAWGALTARFCARRLSGTRRSPGHVGEMILTSAAIPLLAVYWRLAGALHFRARFL